MMPKFAEAQGLTRSVHKCLSSSAAMALAKKPSSTIIPVARRALGGVMQVHDTKAKGGDNELANFLSEEIEQEKKNSRATPLPTALDGFEITLNQSEISLTKKRGDEQITITLNVNHSVESDYEPETEGKAPEEKDATMRCRPKFDIEILKGGNTLAFGCSYMNDVEDVVEPQQEEYQDNFVIEEVTLFKDEWGDDTYAVAGDILDGYLYDLLMNMLEERGVNSEFMEKVSDFATDYEHKLYVGLLGQLQTFIRSN